MCLTIGRKVLLGLAWLQALAGFAEIACAQDWKAKYPEIVYAAAPNENATGMADRMAPMTEYLSKKLGVKVTLRIANDYAAIIEGQRAERIHIGYYGPTAYARAIMTGVKIEPFVIDVYADGSKGYYAVFYVRNDSPFQKIEDLKGKSFALVDPNSTSGGVLPRFAFHRLGIDMDTYFAKVVNVGSHENAIIALQQGTVDVAANWWNNESESNLRRMERKGMAKYDDFRIVFKSDLIAGSPHAYLASLPTDLKKAITEAFVSAAMEAPEAFHKARDGQARPWEPVTHDFYQPTIELNRFVDDLRKRKQ